MIFYKTKLQQSEKSAISASYITINQSIMKGKAPEQYEWSDYSSLFASAR